MTEAQALPQPGDPLWPPPWPSCPAPCLPQAPAGMPPTPVSPQPVPVGLACLPLVCGASERQVIRFLLEFVPGPRKQKESARGQEFLSVGKGRLLQLVSAGDSWSLGHSVPSQDRLVCREQDASLLPQPLPCHGSVPSRDHSTAPLGQPPRGS